MVYCDTSHQSSFWGNCISSLLPLERAPSQTTSDIFEAPWIEILAGSKQVCQPAILHWPQLCQRPMMQEGTIISSTRPKWTMAPEHRDLADTKSISFMQLAVSMEPTQSCPVLTGRWQKVAMFCFQKGLQMSWFRVEDNLPRSLARKTAGKQDLSDISMSYHMKFTCESCFQWLPPLFPTSSSYLPPEAFLAFFKGCPGFPGWKNERTRKWLKNRPEASLNWFKNSSTCQCAWTLSSFQRIIKQSNCVFKNLLMTYTWILKLQLSKCKRRGQGFQEQATWTKDRSQVQHGSLPLGLPLLCCSSQSLTPRKAPLIVYRSGSTERGREVIDNCQYSVCIYNKIYIIHINTYHIQLRNRASHSCNSW